MRSRLILLVISGLMMLSGCASLGGTTTRYTFSTDPSGATVYWGNSPDPASMTPYLQTPYSDVTTVSKGWSNKYFQARKQGYKNSEVYHNPTSAWGRPVSIHLNLESDGSVAQQPEQADVETLAASQVADEEDAAAPEDCVKLAAALYACDQGPSGPFGIVRSGCRSIAKSNFECSLPIDQVMHLR